jgi:hypothetical protein
MTVQLVGLLLASPCIVLYRYHGSDIVHAPVEVLGAIIVGGIVTLVPTVFYAAVLTWVINRSMHRNWPNWAPYAVSFVLTILLFFGLVSLTSRPLPDIAMYFRQHAPDVRRPSLSASEVPLLVASIVAGLLGSWVCVRTLRLHIKQKDAQPSTPPYSVNLGGSPRG